MTLPKDLDLTTVTDTYILAMVNDLLKQVDYLDKEQEERWRKRNQITYQISTLKLELRRRTSEDKVFFKSGQAVRANHNGQVGQVMEDTFDGWILVQSGKQNHPIWWKKDNVTIID